jgi:hypothetical protein
VTLRHRFRRPAVFASGIGTPAAAHYAVQPFTIASAPTALFPVSGQLARAPDTTTYSAGRSFSSPPDQPPRSASPVRRREGKNETMYISIGTIVIIVIIVFLILLLRRRFNEVIFHCCCFELTVTGSGPQAAASGRRLDAR